MFYFEGKKSKSIKKEQLLTNYKYINYKGGNYIFWPVS